MAVNLFFILPFSFHIYYKMYDFIIIIIDLFNELQEMFSFLMNADPYCEMIIKLINYSKKKLIFIITIVLYTG